jgi:hypothetical protein
VILDKTKGSGGSNNCNKPNQETNFAYLNNFSVSPVKALFWKADGKSFGSDLIYKPSRQKICGVWLF